MNVTAQTVTIVVGMHYALTQKDGTIAVVTRVTKVTDTIVQVISYQIMSVMKKVGPLY